MKIPAVIFLFLPLTLHAQLKNTFEDYNLNPWIQFPADRWELSAVSPLQGMYSLHHGYDNTVSGFDRISLIHHPLYLDSMTTKWKFCIRYSCFPSSQNNWMVFLLANQPAAYMNPDSNINAYAVGINLGENDDLLKVYKIRNNHLETIINTNYNWQTGTSILHGTWLEITRNIEGTWSLSVDTTGSGHDFVFLDDGVDKEFSISNYTGIGYRYSSSNDRKLWLDDLEITGLFKEDVEPPAIKNVVIVSSNRIKIEFTEAVNATAIFPALFSVDHEIGLPVAMDIQSPASVVLTFPNSFTSTLEYEISVNGVEDIYGNTMNGFKTKFIYYLAKPYDIVINEIMADPEPAVNLPEIEYIELLNTTDFDISINAWKLTIGEKTISLPSFLISKQAYLIICEARDSLLLKPYGVVLPVEGFPALNNEGQTVTLTNSGTDVIHSVSYTKRWYKNDLKSEGGWSLEMIDPENPCGRHDNWDGSNHYQGGTPGSENSVKRLNPDHTRPYLLRAATTSDTGLLVSFNESLICDIASDPTIYSVNQGIFHPSNVIPVPPDFSTLLLSFPVRFKQSRLYELMVKDAISDCSGNLLNDSYIGFGLACLPDSFDLIINEVLFNAYEDEEFIEIVNRSDKTVELSSLKIVLLDEFTGTLLKTLYEITWPFQLLPGQYAVVTRNAVVLQEHYFCSDPSTLIEATGMSAFPDEEGVIALLDNSYHVIDKFIYKSDFHFELITNTEGISLERLHCDSPTNDPDNWHSAAEDAGFATPGYKNSQSFSPVESFQSTVWLEPEVFTPDNDGNDDYLTLLYHFNPGSMATVMVFDNRGNTVKLLANNVMLGEEGFLTWDGTNTNGTLVNAGIYVVCTEVVSENGNIEKYRNICVLAKMLK